MPVSNPQSYINTNSAWNGKLNMQLVAMQIYGLCLEMSVRFVVTFDQFHNIKKLGNRDLV